MTRLAVRALWRYPVKSMQGEAVQSVHLHPGGVEGDRALALLDLDTGRVASAHHPDVWGPLLQCQARWDGEPGAGEVVVRLPDGREVSAGPRLERELGELVGRRVVLIRENPEGGSYEILHPDVDGAAPAGFLDRTLENAGVRDGRLGQLGVGLDAPRGALVDVSPLHLVTTGSLAALAEAGVDGDLRRFRPNVLLETPPAGGFDEESLVGSVVQLGEVPVRLTMPTPRCIVPTLAQAGVEKSTAVLRTLAARNRLTMGGGDWACLGLYGHPDGSGRVALDCRWFGTAPGPTGWP